MMTENMMTMWDSATKMMGTSPMASMMASTRKSVEQSMGALQTMTDSFSVMSKRGQQISQDMMAASMSHMKEVATSKDAADAMTKNVEFAAEMAEMALESMGELSQVWGKSSSEAQQTLHRSALASIKTMRDETLKAMSSEEMKGSINAARSMTGWMSDANTGTTTWWKSAWWANPAAAAAAASKPSAAAMMASAPKKMAMPAGK